MTEKAGDERVGRGDRDETETTEHFIRAIFKAELHTICAQARQAAGQLEEALENHKRPTRVWLSVQTILVLAGNASKLLWGKEADIARRQLRVEAGVKKDSPLRSRQIRNAFEHIDQQIISWARAGNNRFAHRSVDWSDNPSIVLPDGDKFGHFDPVVWEVTFLDEEPISLKLLLAELGEIRERLQPVG